jgi:hypothetical protein
VNRSQNAVGLSCANEEYTNFPMNTLKMSSNFKISKVLKSGSERGNAAASSP